MNIARLTWNGIWVVLIVIDIKFVIVAYNDIVKRRISPICFKKPAHHIRHEDDHSFGDDSLRIAIKHVLWASYNFHTLTPFIKCRLFNASAPSVLP